MKKPFAFYQEILYTRVTMRQKTKREIRSIARVAAKAAVFELEEDRGPFVPTEEEASEFCRVAAEEDTKRHIALEVDLLEILVKDGDTPTVRILEALDYRMNGEAISGVEFKLQESCLIYSPSKSIKHNIVRTITIALPSAP